MEKEENIREYQKKLIVALAEGIAEYCKKWDYNHVEQLMEDKTDKNFVKIFCKITNTYFFKHMEETYGATFAKKELSVKIYKCGKECEKILLQCPIQWVVDEL